MFFLITKYLLQRWRVVLWTLGWKTASPLHKSEVERALKLRFQTAPYWLPIFCCDSCSQLQPVSFRGAVWNHSFQVHSTSDQCSVQIFDSGWTNFFYSAQVWLIDIGSQLCTMYIVYFWPNFLSPPQIPITHSERGSFRLINHLSPMLLNLWKDSQICVYILCFYLTT